VPELDCVLVAVTRQVPDANTCSATFLPARAGTKVAVAAPESPSTRLPGSDNEPDWATTVNVLDELAKAEWTVPPMVTLRAKVRSAYPPTAGARKLVVKEPVLVDVVFARVIQLVPDFRCTDTGREAASGNVPMAFTISAAIAVEGARTG